MAINASVDRGRVKASAHVLQPEDDLKVLYARGSAGLNEGRRGGVSADVRTSVLHYEDGENETDWLQAKAGTWGDRTGAGVSASANLVDVNAHGVGGKVGIGVDTGVSVKDGSVSASVLGTGITVGRKMKISVLGNEIGLDLGQIFRK